MKVAILVHKFPELSETFIVNHITGLIDGGHEVDIYATGAGRSSEVHSDVHRYQLLRRTHYWNLPGSYMLRAIDIASRIRDGRWRPAALALSLMSSTVRSLRAQRYDVIHCEFSTLARTACALHDIGAVSGKLVVSFRGWDLTSRKIRGPDPEGVFQRAHLCLPVCERFKEQLIGRGCDPKKIRVHHSGIKLGLFPYAERRRTTSEPTRLLTVGRLVEKKGVAYAIQAIARLKASGRKIFYTVAGDGPLRLGLDRMVAELGLEAEVELLGRRRHEEVIALLRKAHLFVAPCVTADSGDQEGIPNTVKEAMATGIPVVSTRHSGIPELVESGVSGLLVTERDSEALANALAFLIDHPERWPFMGRAGRERVEAEFDSDRLNKELIELYHYVISGGIRPVGAREAQSTLDQDSFDG